MKTRELETLFHGRACRKHRIGTLPKHPHSEVGFQYLNTISAKSLTEADRCEIGNQPGIAADDVGDEPTIGRTDLLCRQ